MGKRANGRRETWPGGYVRKTHGGQRYIIERWSKGRRVHVSTGCHTLRGAMRELERFESDPDRYTTAEVVSRPILTHELIDEYRAHQLERGLTPEWASECRRNLQDWREVLLGRDLRTLDLYSDLKRAVDGWTTQRPHRIKALKGFMRWLVEEKGTVSHRDNAAASLRVPQSRPEKHVRRKVVPREDVQAVLAVLPAVTRDILHLMTATGFHLSEVRRFAASGELVVPMGAQDVLAVVIVRQKSGGLTKTPLVFSEHVEAAKRLRARGSIPNRMTTSRHMIAACDKANVPWFGLGQIRHSFCTWAVEDGASVRAVSEFVDHKSESTTKRFYLDLAVPRASVPIARLEVGPESQLAFEFHEETPRKHTPQKSTASTPWQGGGTALEEGKIGGRRR